MEITKDWVNVSHSIGSPFGAIGTGYGVFGKYGFVRQNFESIPDPKIYEDHTNTKYCDYYGLPDDMNHNFIGLKFIVDNQIYLVQSEKTSNSNGKAADEFISYAFLPFSKHIAKYISLGLEIEIVNYTPLIPHNLDVSTTPVLCMELTLKNTSDKTINGRLFFEELCDMKDGIKCAFLSDEDYEFSIIPNDTKSTVAFLAWYYPEFITPTPCDDNKYVRYYTKKFNNPIDVIEYAKSNYADWKGQIIKWQDSFSVPSEFKRMWFSSLSSVITSTMMSADPYFFEIESPHYWINTMDVTIYSGWIYMINWPEIEKMDMYQYKKAIHSSGEKKGYVWHSLWTDATHYVEEPCFITRIYRDYLWYNDKKFLSDFTTTINDALNRVYVESYDGLIESLHGNQSYDLWKMPGVSTYVNMAWLYALYSVLQINEVLNSDISLPDKSVQQALDLAKKSFEKYLWNEEGYFNAFFRTPNANKRNIQDAVFTDQMFGRWLLLIERNLNSIIPFEKVKKSLDYVYNNNLVDNKHKGFRGWVNGKLKDKQYCSDNSQLHVKTCWIGAQLDLSSLLGEIGEEEKSLDVFFSVEKSLKNNHLAVGEWNQTITETGDNRVSDEEPAKDTPRFPPYPRYKCSWEMLIRILGLKMDECYLELCPFKSFGFELNDLIIAGCKLTVKSEKNWNKIFVDGIESPNAIFDRNIYEHNIEFIKF